MSVFKGFIFQKTTWRHLHRPESSDIHIQAQSFLHMHTQRWTKIHIPAKDSKCGSMFPLFCLAQAERRSCSIWTWHIQCIYLATLHYLKYLICCTLSFSPNGYFYVKCTFLTIMSYNLVAKDNFLPHVTEYLSFKLNEVSDHYPIMWKCT